MTDSGEDEALFKQALQRTGSKAMIMATPSLVRLLQQGAVNLAAAVPAMTAAAVRGVTSANCSNGSGGECVRQAPCNCPVCLAEDDAAQHGPSCTCLACLPAGASMADEAPRQWAVDYLSRDASISFVDSEGGPHLGVQSAAGHWLTLQMVMVDTGASVTVIDYDTVLGLGLSIKPASNLKLRIVSSSAQDVEGIVSTKLVFKPGTRHELVVPAQMMAVKGLGGLATMLLGRVEQHRIGAVVDTMQQLLFYMPKLHLGRRYKASIPLVCHKPGVHQTQLQQLPAVGVGNQQRAASAAAGRLLLAGDIEPNPGPVAADLYTLVAWYVDDALVLDTSSGRHMLARLPSPVTSLLQLGSRQAAWLLLQRLIRSGDVELNPGPVTTADWQLFQQRVSGTFRTQPSFASCWVGGDRH